MRALTLLLVSAITLSTQAQQSSNDWHVSEDRDPLHGTDFLKLILVGKYLQEPRGGSTVPPMLVIRCAPGKRGKFNGAFVDGFVAIHAVADSRVRTEPSPWQAPTFVPVELKLDDRKLQLKEWSASTDGQSVFFSSMQFNNLIYGHELPHKPGKGDQVRRIMMGIPEFLGAEVMVEFELPDTSKVADACGAVSAK